MHRSRKVRVRRRAPDFQVSIRVKQQILWLQITMAYATCMTMGQTFDGKGKGEKRRKEREEKRKGKRRKRRRRMVGEMEMESRVEKISMNE